MKRVFIAGIFSLASLAVAHTANMSPMSLKRPAVADMEYVKFACYSGGEFSFYLYNLFSLSKNGKILLVYSGAFGASAPVSKMPRSLRDFPTRYVIDLEKLTMVEMEENFSNIFFSAGGQSGPKDFLWRSMNDIFDTRMQLDYSKLVCNCKFLYWDGISVRTKTAKIKLKKGYSYFYMNDLTYLYRMIGTTEAGGIIYLVMPQFLKDPVPLSIKKTGIDNIETPAGNFKAYKYSGYTADPFLGSLMKPWMDTTFIWADTNGLVVKYSNPNNYGVIMEKGIWTGAK
jgi:hypothetical protein